MKRTQFTIAMLSVHSSPLGELGSRDTGGMSVYIRELAREMGRAGHIVDIFTAGHQNGLPEEVDLSENVKLINVPVGGNGRLSKDAVYPYLADFFRKIEARRILKGISYDLVHSHYWLSGIVGSMVQRSWDIPHVMKFHTTAMAKRVHCSEEKEDGLRIEIEKRLARECTKIIAPTKREKTLLHKYFDVPYDRITVIPCGVDPDVFRPLRKETAREELGLGRCGSVALYVGRFVPIKGIDRLMHAMAYHRSFKRDLKLVMVGGDDPDSEKSAALRVQAHRLGILDAVRFEGRVPHEKLPLYFSAADALIVTSYYESFGLVALESLACGTPVISTRVGVIDGLIQSGITGEIVENPDPHSIARAMENVLARQQDGQFSPGTIRSSVLGYAWPAIASSVLKEYSALIHSGHSEFVSVNRPGQKSLRISPPVTARDNGEHENNPVIKSRQRII